METIFALKLSLSIESFFFRVFLEEIFDDPIFYLFLCRAIRSSIMSYYLVACLVLLSPILADKPSESYAPSVKYGGPIVYSGEKPPIIHFPPPPEKVSHTLNFWNKILTDWFSRQYPMDPDQAEKAAPHRLSSMCLYLTMICPFWSTLRTTNLRSTWSTPPNPNRLTKHPRPTIKNQRSPCISLNLHQNPLTRHLKRNLLTRHPKRNQLTKHLKRNQLPKSRLTMCPRSPLCPNHQHTSHRHLRSLLIDPHPQPNQLINHPSNNSLISLSHNLNKGLNNLTSHHPNHNNNTSRNPSLNRLISSPSPIMDLHPSLTSLFMIHQNSIDNHPHRLMVHPSKLIRHLRPRLQKLRNPPWSWKDTQNPTLRISTRLLNKLIMNPSPLMEDHHRLNNLPMDPWHQAMDHPSLNLKLKSIRHLSNLSTKHPSLLRIAIKHHLPRSRQLTLLTTQARFHQANQYLWSLFISRLHLHLHRLTSITPTQSILLLPPRNQHMLHHLHHLTLLLVSLQLTAHPNLRHQLTILPSNKHQHMVHPRNKIMLHHLSQLTASLSHQHIVLPSLLIGLQSQHITHPSQLTIHPRSLLMKHPRSLLTMCPSLHQNRRTRHLKNLLTRHPKRSLLIRHLKSLSMKHPRRVHLRSKCTP